MFLYRNLRARWCAVALALLPLFLQTAKAQERPQPSSASQVAQPQANDPAVVVSIGDLTKVQSDITYIMRSAGVAEFSGMVTLMTNQYSQGLDRKRPSGIAISGISLTEMPNIVFYLPVTDRKQFFGGLQTIANIKDLDNGTIAIAAGPQQVFAKEQGGWLHVASAETSLANLHPDPSSLFKSLSERYDIAVKVAVPNIPADIRNMVMQQVKEGYAQASKMQNQNLSAEDAEAAEKMGRQSIEELERNLNEIDQLVVGWAVDAQNKKTYIDSGVQFVRGSKLEKEATDLAKLKTNFPAFQDNKAAFGMRASALVSPEDYAQARQAVDAQLKVLMNSAGTNGNLKLSDGDKKFVKDLSDVFMDALKNGTIDGGLHVTLGDRYQIIAGGTIGDGPKLTKLIRDHIAASRQSPAPTVKFDAYKHQNYTFHVGSVPVKIADPNAKKIFGDKVTFALAVADKSALVAIGDNSETALKAFLDRNAAALNSTQPGSPFEMHAELRPILAFANSIEPAPPVAAMLQTLEQFADLDSVSVTSRVIERGILYRLNVEEGVLRSIGAAAKAGRPGAGF